MSCKVWHDYGRKERAKEIKIQPRMKNILSAAAVLLLAGTLVLPREAAAQYRRSGVSFPQPYAQAYDIEVLRDTALERRVLEYAAARSYEQPEVWTLHDCMQYAVAHSPEMRLQQATNDDRRIDRREAAFGFLPTISAGSSGSFSFGRGIDPETNVYTNTTTFSNSYSLSANLDLFNGFSAVNNFRIAKTAVLLGIEEEQIKKDDICLQVIQAYYNVLYYRGMVELAREQLEESRTTEPHDSGTGPRPVGAGSEELRRRPADRVGRGRQGLQPHPAGEYPRAGHPDPQDRYVLPLRR